MADEADGIEEALAGQVRVMVTAAGLVGEAAGRAREQQQRRAQAASEQHARALQSRIDAERAVARAELAGVHRPEWWNRATPEQIGSAYQVARAWSREDPEAVRAKQRISQELRSRYGVDAANAGADPAAVRAAVKRAQQDRERGTQRLAEAWSDQAEAQVLLTLADQQDRRADDARQAAVHESDPDERAAVTAQAGVHHDGANSARGAGEALYDSAERREQTARDLESHGVGAAAAAARMSADVSQARPATDAISGPVAIRSAARRTRAHGPQIQHAHTER